jgi:hypothetical protein
VKKSKAFNSARMMQAIAVDLWDIEVTQIHNSNLENLFQSENSKSKKNKNHPTSKVIDKMTLNKKS